MPALLLAYLALAPSPAQAQVVGPAVDEDRASSSREAESPAATLPLPVMIDGARHGTVTATVTLSDVLTVSPRDLAEVLAPLVSDSGLAALRALGDDPVPAGEVRALGIDIAFDSPTISLRVTIALSLRREQTFSIAPDPRFAGLERVEPSSFAMGLTGALVINSRLDGNVSPRSNLLLSGFANIGGAGGVHLLFGGDFNLTAGGDVFRRDRLLAFVDDQRRALRYSAGDIAPLQQRLGGRLDLLGISIERNYQELQPLRNVRPIGRRSFLLERRSLVEIYVNGALVQSFTAEPGTIDIRDLPLAALSNNVSIVVEDDLGRRELDNFSLGSDLSLLEPGIDEFNLSLGLLRSADGLGLAYSGDPALSLYYSRGVTERLTLTGHAIVTEAIQNFGGSAAIAGFGGITAIESAVSHDKTSGAGVAVGISYRGDPFGQSGRDGFLNLRIEGRSRDFREANSFPSIEHIKFDIAADYRLSLAEGTALSFGASIFARHGVSGTERSAFVGLVQSLGPFAVSGTLRYLDQPGRERNFGVFLTLSVPVGRRGSAYASYDSLTDTARGEYRYRRSLELPEIDYAVRAQRSPEGSEVGGRFGYVTPRFDAVADVSQRFQGGTGTDATTGSLRLQSGIAYVDGRLGIGRDPGRGFLMVRRHESLKSGRVEVSSGGAGRALGSANTVGPAVIPLFAPYRPQEIRVSPIDAPAGYDIGTGGYLLLPGAASGLSIEVGSDAYRVVLAILSTEDEVPLALMTGQVRSLATGAALPFFTNSRGRAAFNRLSPGRYRIELDNSDWVYEFDVADDDPALIDLGRLRMEAAQ